MRNAKVSSDSSTPRPTPATMPRNSIVPTTSTTTPKPSIKSREWSPAHQLFSRLPLQRSANPHATINIMPASAASGSSANKGPPTRNSRATVTAPAKAAWRPRPPACRVARARTRVNTSGTPPNRLLITLPQPRAISSRSGSWRVLINWSTARALSDDSSPPIAASASAVNPTWAACACSRSTPGARHSGHSAASGGCHGQAGGMGPTVAPTSAGLPSAASRAHTAEPATSASSGAGSLGQRCRHSQMKPAVAKPSARAAGRACCSAARLSTEPGGRPKSSGNCARTINSAAPFMKPANTGCGTTRARRAQPNSPKAT